MDHNRYQFSATLWLISSTKCISVMVVFLWSWVQVYPYLAEWLIRGQSRNQVETHVELIQLTFQDLGLLINK